MFRLKILATIANPWLWLMFILTACAGVSGTKPAPTMEPTQERVDELPGENDLEARQIPADKYADLEIVTLLPRDAIPAIDNPRFLPVADADDYYDPDELVIGVVFDGDARAYSIPYLSNREIVNDTVGGVKIAVTW